MLIIVKLLNVMSIRRRMMASIKEAMATLVYLEAYLWLKWTGTRFRVVMIMIPKLSFLNSYYQKTIQIYICALNWFNNLYIGGMECVSTTHSDFCRWIWTQFGSLQFDLNHQILPYDDSEVNPSNSTIIWVIWVGFCFWKSSALNLALTSPKAHIFWLN